MTIEQVDSLPVDSLPVDSLPVVKPSIIIENTDGLSYLQTIGNNSIDFVLTDPPYIISKETGMNKHYHTVKSNETKDILSKNEQNWETYIILPFIKPIRRPNK